MNTEIYSSTGVRNAKTHSVLFKNFLDTTSSMTRTTYHLRPNGAAVDVERSSRLESADGTHEDPHRKHLQM